MLIANNLAEIPNTMEKPEESQFYVFGSCAPFEDHALSLRGRLKKPFQSLSEIFGNNRKLS